MSDSKEISISNKELEPSNIDERSLKEIFVQSSTQKPNNAAFDNIAHVFSIFAGAYGQKWNEQFENSNSRDTWTVVLWEYSAEILNLAVKQTLKECKFPPNLVQFQQICKNVSTPSSTSVEGYYQKMPKRGDK